MHLLMVSALPAFALLHHSGSARCPRATPTRSQQPSVRIASATSGSLMFATAMSGILTCFLISAAMYFFHPCSIVPGSMQAVNLGLSGIMQLMSRKSTPAFSSSAAILQVAARSFPRSPRNSSAERRTPSGKPLPQAARISARISSRNRRRFSKLPP